MPVTEGDLVAVLHHCRALSDAADQLDAIAVERHDAGQDALADWTGDLADVFVARRDDEASDLASCAADLRADADAWAQVWADTVNDLNARRREGAVERLRAERSFGEQFVDTFVGDDSDALVRPWQPVTVPTSATGYAATGGLETF